MNKFKVGDKVKVKKGVSTKWYEAGAEGEILEVFPETVFVKFSAGKFDRDCNSSWYADDEDLEVMEEVKEKKLKSKQVKKSSVDGYAAEGDGYAVTAWGVEVNGELKVSTVSTTRAIAREERSYQEAIGNKAVVRKVQIQAMKGKI